MNPPEDDIELRIHQAEVAGKREGRAQGWREALEAALALDWDCGLNDVQKEMLRALLQQGPPKEDA